MTPHGCDHLGCPALAVRLISWRNAIGGAGRTWACEEHVEDLRQEAFDTGCTVIGPISRARASCPRCHRDISLRRDGKLREHGLGVRCTGEEMRDVG